jgi:serine/threonine protein kinase
MQEFERTDDELREQIHEVERSIRLVTQRLEHLQSQLNRLTQIQKDRKAVLFGRQDLIKFQPLKSSIVKIVPVDDMRCVVDQDIERLPIIPVAVHGHLVKQITTPQNTPALLQFEQVHQTHQNETADLIQQTRVKGMGRLPFVAFRHNPSGVLQLRAFMKVLHNEPAWSFTTGLIYEHGVPLAGEIKKNVWSMSQNLLIWHSIANAVLGLHTNGIIHGLLRSESIALIYDETTACPKTKIFDFREARYANEKSKSKGLGSRPLCEFWWQAMELFDENETTFASDIYSLAMVSRSIFFFLLLSSRVTFSLHLQRSDARFSPKNVLIQSTKHILEYICFGENKKKKINPLFRWICHGIKRLF